MHFINHIDYTKAAVTAFKAFKGIDIGSQDIFGTLEKASADEDSANPLTEGFHRISNWHFYNNGNSIKDSSGVPGRRTSEKRINKLIKALDKRIEGFSENPTDVNAEILLQKAGRVLHHIQDMSTPTHVVPVYHGPDLKDEYETYGKQYAGKLAITYSSSPTSPDHWKVAITQSDIETDLQRLQSSPGEDHILFRLYVDSAKKTLKDLTDGVFSARVNNAVEEFDWNSFWKEHDKDKPANHGFGCFGKLGNNFGRSYFTSDENLYEVAPEVYFELYKYFYKKSVVDSVYVLNYINQRCKVLTHNLDLPDGFVDFGDFETP